MRHGTIAENTNIEKPIMAFKLSAAKGLVARKMLEKRKEAQNCHLCGLENFDACEDGSVHKPALEKNELPCASCARNPDVIGGRFDFYDEQWTREFTAKNGLGKCFIEDPDPQEQELLRNLHKIVNQGGEKLGE